MSSTIELTDIGPVKHVTIPVPEGGGIVCLRSRNGRGKSETLKAVETLVAGNGKLSARDGALRGEVEGFGARLTVSRATRRSGELEVTTLEGRLCVSDLVNPGLKSPEAADAKRIKALIQLSEADPNVELFVPLVGDRAAFDAVVTPTAIETDDILVMADRIKRCLEAAARQAEAAAENVTAQARAAADQVSGIDLEAESDADVLQADLEAAIKAEAELTARDTANTRAAESVQAARDALEDAEAEYKGPSVEDARKQVVFASDTRGFAANRVAALERELEIARGELKDREADLQAANDKLTAAENHERLVAGWRETIEQAETTVAKPVTIVEIEAAEAAVKAARERLEQGAIIRRAKKKLAEAKAATDIATGHRKAAEKLRDAARGTDDVLSSLVAKCCQTLRVVAGRLVTDTPTRGETYFGELSDGERWRIGIDVALEALAEKVKPILVIPQAAFGELDPIARAEINEHAKRRNVLILTAEASVDEEITAGVFEG